MGAYTPTSKVLQPSDNTLIYVLDGSYTTLTVIDTYESFIWTERYLEAGDFELYLPIDARGIKQLQVGNYLSIVDSPNYMISRTWKLRVISKMVTSLLSQVVLSVAFSTVV